MNTSALIVMVTAYTIITGFTLYFFYRVLKTPAHKGDHTPKVKSFDAT